MTTIAGRYEIGQRLGAGGMATVWRAQDTRLDRAVAIKILHPNLAADPTFQARFEREARQVAALNHPNIVTVFDFGTSDGSFYLVMELVEGESLATLLAREGRLDASSTEGICSAVLAALDQAHRAGIVHRDITPSNILLSGAGQIKLADFGIARSMSDSTQLTDTGALMGTVVYLSPEQCAGQSAAPTSDLYAVGCVAYQCLVGHAPFVGESPASVMYQHQHAPAAPLPLLAPGVPANLQLVISRALEKDPGQRYRSASEMATALSGHEMGTAKDPAGPTEGIERTRTIDPRLTPTASRRWRPSWWAVATAVVLILIGAGLFAWATQKSPTTSAPPAHSAQKVSEHSSTTSGAAVAPTTTSSNATQSVALSVVDCNTSYGNPSQQITPPPSQLQAQVPASLASDASSTLGYYALGDNQFEVLGPIGWDCSGGVGADGSSTLTVVPSDESGSLGGTSQLTGSQTPEAIYATNNGGCAGCAYSQACGLFPEANTSYAQSLGSCASPPSEESDDHLSSSEVAFEDPAGVSGTGVPSGGPNPSNGIITFRGTEGGGGSNYPTSYLVTCELPSSEHSVCTASLNEFLIQNLNR